MTEAAVPGHLASGGQPPLGRPDAGPAPTPSEGSFWDEGSTLASWLFTTDHKRIGMLYAISITAFFFLSAGRRRR